MLYFYAKNDGYITSSDGEDALFRVQTGVFHVKANAEAYLAEVEAAGIDAYITTQAIEEALVEPESYTLKQFIRDVQFRWAKQTVSPEVDLSVR